MEFRRIENLPPYVFTIINNLKIEARRAGRDVIDLGFGNPDLPSPEIAVEKLAEAARNTRNHRYSASRGIPKLRQAVAALYARKFGVTLDPETEVLSTIGAKEGFSHLMWVLLQPGDAALVPSPSYPIHIWGPYFAGADARQVPVGTGEDYVSNVMQAWDLGWPKPRVVVLSFPHNPTTATVELADLQRLVDWARERDVVLVHDDRNETVDVHRVAQEVWYPLWDAGANIDHSVRALSEVSDTARADPRVALGLLDARHVA